jgi:hypothetical protein
MFISKLDSKFDVSISEIDGEWEARIIEHNVNRITSTCHLRHSWTSLELALEGVQRRWQRLFPSDPSPDFRDAITQPLTASYSY